MKKIRIPALIRIGRPDKPRKQRHSLSLLFSLAVGAVLLSALGLAMLAVWGLTALGVGGGEEEIGFGLSIVLVGVISLLLGTVLSFLLSKIPLRPINNLIDCMNRLAEGDFKTRLTFGSTIAEHPTFREISNSVNKLAEELENTEMLRGDFINNFSHEFKTPIVSIAGLAKLVARGNLDEEERKQYLAAIEQESMRLASMATNVLHLTKIENQTILSGESEFNLSEQIRSCVLLLENKWTQKHTELQLDFEEYTIRANEELLKQVWINLVDNAVKFSPEYSTVSIRIALETDELRISITNEGDPIPPEHCKKIFNKFYQADESHAAQGNGIGLAIVKRVIELHDGRVEVLCDAGRVTFVVCLPCLSVEERTDYPEK